MKYELKFWKNYLLNIICWGLVAYLAIGILTSCGDDSGGGGGSGSSVSNSDEVSIDELTELEKSESPKTVSVGARLVKEKKDLNECEEPEIGSLVYVQADSQFMFCDENLSWAEIDLRGTSGKDGENGKNGSKGDKGADGEKITLSKGEWINPITKDRYFLFIDDFDKWRCPEGSSLPETRNEIAAAYFHFEEAFVYQNSETSFSWFSGFVSRTIDKDSEGEIVYSGGYPRAVVICKVEGDT